MQDSSNADSKKSGSKKTIARLFTDKRLTDADRERFVLALEALARSGIVWVLATVRSDFYQLCQRMPALMRMKAVRSARKEREPVSVRVDPTDGLG